MKQLESTQHASSRSVQERMRAWMNSELAVSVVSAYCWVTVAISERMFGNESYQYRYSVWIEAWLMQGL